MRSIIKNKRGQIQGVILGIVTIFIVAIVFLFTNHLDKQIFEKFDEILVENEDFNNTEAQLTTEKFADIEGSRIWDWGFLAIFVGVFIQMMILSFASRVNVAFFWIFALMGLFVLIIGTMLSNIWQEVAMSPEFVETITRFPITDFLLGTYGPMVVTALLFLGMIVLFGKFPGGQQ